MERKTRGGRKKRGSFSTCLKSDGQVEVPWEFAVMLISSSPVTTISWKLGSPGHPVMHLHQSSSVPQSIPAQSIWKQTGVETKLRMGSHAACFGLETCLSLTAFLFPESLKILNRHCLFNMLCLPRNEIPALFAYYWKIKTPFSPPPLPMQSSSPSPVRSSRSHHLPSSPGQERKGTDMQHDPPQVVAEILSPPRRSGPSPSTGSYPQATMGDSVIHFYIFKYFYISVS